MAASGAISLGYNFGVWKAPPLPKSRGDRLSGKTPMQAYPDNANSPITTLQGTVPYPLCGGLAPSWERLVHHDRSFLRREVFVLHPRYARPPELCQVPCRGFLHCLQQTHPTMKVDYFTRSNRCIVAINRTVIIAWLKSRGG